MKDLTIQTELIKIGTDIKGNMTVSGRELHAFLQVETRYRAWMPRMIAYGFVEGIDFNPHIFGRVRMEGAREVEREVIDHLLTVGMAKEICMIQRTERGKQARQYFISIEKAWNTPEKIMARALKVADETIKDQAKQIAAMQPKALFADAVSASETSILIGGLAKLIKQNGVDIGQKRLFDWLREHGFLIKNGTDKNMPTQRAMERGLFEVKEGSFVDGNGVNRITRTTKVTGKGQIYFVNRFLKAVEVP